MIIGSIEVRDDAVITHTDSYVLDSVTVVSTRRPLLAAGVMGAFGFGGFGIAFNDILWADELIALSVGAAGSLLIGTQVGLLSLLSRDLKNLEQSAAIWGWYRSLRQHRTSIVEAIARRKEKAGV